MHEMQMVYHSASLTSVRISVNFGPVRLETAEDTEIQVRVLLNDEAMLYRISSSFNKMSELFCWISNVYSHTFESSLDE